MLDPVTIRQPAGEAVPVVFDSPHSGAHYPEDFEYAVPLATLRRGEDAFVDELFGAAPDHGAVLIAAMGAVAVACAIFGPRLLGITSP